MNKELPVPLKDAIPLEQVRRVLVIKLRHHGDVLLSSPVFSALKAAAPHGEIDALVYADTAEMLDGHPAIRQVLGIDRNWKKLGLLAQFKAEWALFRQLRAGQYDLVIHLTEHWRGAWLVRLLKPRWAVGMQRGDKRWRKMFTHCYAHPKNALRHVVEANLDALRRIGIYPSPDARRLQLVPGAAAESRVAALLAEAGLAGKAFIHIHPASRWFFKCWTVDGMVGLISRLQSAGWPVVLTAAPSADELAQVAAIQSRLSQPIVSLAGQLSLKELAALSAQARLFVGVDSAPMHIAAAVATPVVALFGPSGDKQWGAWPSGAPVRLVSSTQHACRPCGIDGCGGSKVSDCLVSLSADEVFAAVEHTLSESSNR